ncbi:MAG: YbaN family protein [Marinomonas sp.]|uniref:YbaN family protein n=1 Tax=Parasphingorhabdus sp. TaxID=2709688 RepID=UPI003287EA2E
MRPIYLTIGILSVALGAIGAFLPLLPTVPFLLLAVFCFARSNKEWEQRILNHPTWGPQVRDWQERRAISRRSKMIAIATLIAGAVFSWVTVGAPWAYASLAVVAISGSWIATRNE